MYMYVLSIFLIESLLENASLISVLLAEDDISSKCSSGKKRYTLGYVTAFGSYRR